MLICPFEKQVEKGPLVTMHISDAIACAVGEHKYLIPSTKAPMIIKKARVYAGDTLVFVGDIDLEKAAEALHRIAKFYNVGITMSCDDLYNDNLQPCWSSQRPNRWLGYYKVRGKILDSCLLVEAVQFYKKFYRVPTQKAKPTTADKKIKFVKPTSALEKSIRKAMSKKHK